MHNMLILLVTVGNSEHITIKSKLPENKTHAY